METKYTKEYFIAKFEAIPDDQWCIAKFTDDFNTQCHCALGHCGMNHHNYTKEADALLDLCSSNIVAINDGYGYGYNKKYKGDTPKERVLNFLKSLN